MAKILKHVTLIKSDDDTPTPLQLEIRRLQKQVDAIKAERAVILEDVERKNEIVKTLASRDPQAIAKALVAQSEKLIKTQVEHTARKDGESDAALYNRAMTENPKVYTALELAKGVAAVDHYQCQFGAESRADVGRIEKAIESTVQAQRRDGEAFAAAYTRVLGENPSLYVEYEQARRSA